MFSGPAFFFFFFFVPWHLRFCVAAFLRWLFNKVAIFHLASDGVVRVKRRFHFAAKFFLAARTALEAAQSHERAVGRRDGSHPGRELAAARRQRAARGGCGQACDAQGSRPITGHSRRRTAAAPFASHERTAAVASSRGTCADANIGRAFGFEDDALVGGVPT